MNLFNFTLDKNINTTSKEDNKVSLEEENISSDNLDKDIEILNEELHTKIEELDNKSISVSTESDNNIDINIKPSRDYLTWGIFNGQEQQREQPPTFTYLKNEENEYIVYLFGLREHSGIFYQFFNNLNENDVVTLHIFDIYFEDTLLIQSALQNTKSHVITKMYMCDCDPTSSCQFFIWMLGNTLEKIPYDVISLCEPFSPFSFANSPKLPVKQNYMEIDASIKQQWYDYAVNKGLLTLEEVGMLNEGKVIFINDINNRIKNNNRGKNLALKE